MLTAYLLDQRPPLEAQLIDVADEIAYLTADLDDGVESGLLDIDHICAHIGIMDRAYHHVAEKHTGVEQNFLFHEALQWMQRELTCDLIATTAANVSSHGIGTVQDVRKCAVRLAHFSDHVEQQRREEKEYLFRLFYTCPTLDAEHRKAENVITTLFHFYMSDPARMPTGYMEESATEGLPRVVADYIAGMTDSYIFQQFWVASKAMR